jgi:hypothetical protein
MKISRAHKNFAARLRHQTSLEYPERFLGPNWKDVLNFWLYLDTLSREELKIVHNRYCALGWAESLKNLTLNAAKVTIGYEYEDAAWLAPTSFASAYATLELIGSHNLEAFTFLPLFLNL